jgi:hypothetical protein
MPVVVCDHCRTSVEVNLEHLDTEVECGRCSRAFVAKEIRADRAPHDPGYDDDAPEQPRRRRRFDDADFDDHPDETLAEARKLSRGAALGLMIINAVSLLLLVVGVAIIVLFLLNVPPGRGGGMGGAEMIIVFGFYGVYGLIAVAKMLLGFFGGRAMMRLGSYGWAMAGAVATIVPLDGCLSIIFVPFGIWAIVVLQKPEVKWAMRRNAKRER